MLKNYLAFLATGLLCSLPAYADFSGNGNVWVDCYASPLCPTSGQVTDSFSSLTTTAPNTQSGSAYASDVWGDYMSLSVSGQQTTTSSPTSFSIKWVMTGSMSGFGIGGGGAVLGTGGTFGFVDLPTAGLLHITATMQGDMGSGGYGFASDAWNLQGPESWENYSPAYWSYDETVPVGPGAYYGNYAVSGTFCCPTINLVNDTYNLNVSETLTLSAYFTPIPEPRWIAAVPLALLLLPFVRRTTLHRRFS